MKYQHKILVIPDIHLFWKRAEMIIQKYTGTHKFVILGDEFDNFSESVEDNRLAAIWLKSSLKDPNRIHIKGNHTEHYDPRINIFCSGFSVDKKRAINSVLSIEDWDKLKYFHYENGWFFSHAGLTKQWFLDPKDDTMNVSYIQKVIDDAVIKQRMGNYDNAIWASDRFRGGQHKKGGILWNDWRNSDFILNTKQVVGHSPINRIQKLSDNVFNSHLINVDSSLTKPLMDVLEIDENGGSNVITLPEIL